MKKSVAQIAVLFLSILPICAGCQSRYQRVRAQQTYDLDMGYEQALLGTCNGLLSYGFTIDYTDKELGIITSKRYGRQVTKTSVGLVLFIIPYLEFHPHQIEEGLTLLFTPLADDRTRMRAVFVSEGKQKKGEKVTRDMVKDLQREVEMIMREAEEEAEEAGAQP